MMIVTSHTIRLRSAARDIRAGSPRPLGLLTRLRAGPSASAFAATLMGRYGAGRRFWPPLVLALARPPAPLFPTAGTPGTPFHHTTVNLRPRLVLTFLTSPLAAATARRVPGRNLLLPAVTTTLLRLPYFRPRRSLRLVQVEQRTQALQRIRANRAAFLLERVLVQGRRVEGWQGAQPTAISAPAAGPLARRHPEAKQEDESARLPSPAGAEPVRRVLRQLSSATDGVGSTRPGAAELAPESRWNHQRQGNRRSQTSIHGEDAVPAQPLTLPPQELNRVTDHVMQTLERRVQAFRERTGRI